MRRKFELVVALGIFFGGMGLAQAQSKADAPLDGGWSSSYGVLFNFQNPFAQQLNILSDFQGGIGGQINLSPTAAVRVGLQLGHTSNPAVDQTNTTTTVAGGTTTTVETKSLDYLGGYTSTFNTQLSGSYLMRLGTAALAPYFGGGLSLGWSRGSVSYTDKNFTATTERTVDNSDNTFGLGAHGLFGVDWRVLDNVSVFAEYGLGVTLFSQTSENTNQKTTTTATGDTTTVKTSLSRSRVLNFDTGLTQAGMLGLLIFF